MGALFATDFWPDDFWAEGMFGDPALGFAAGSGFWAPNFWIDTAWSAEFWANDPGSVSAGSITASFSGVTAAAAGDYDAPGSTIRTGQIASTLDGVSGSLGGTLAYLTFFDLEVAVSVNWQLQDLPAVEGTVDATLDDLTCSLAGAAWDQSYSVGFIGLTETLWPHTFWDERFFAGAYWPKTGALDDLSASLAGTISPPGQFTGSLATSLDDVTGSLVGRFTAAANYNGQLLPTLDGLTASFVGDTERPLFGGSATATLDGLTSAIVGIVTPAGAFNARIQTQLAGIASQLVGTFTVPARDAQLDASLEGVAFLAQGLALPEGSRLGQITARLDGLAALLSGLTIVPALQARGEAPQVTTIDWKTLTDQYNRELEPVADYEFSNGRKFYQG